MSAAPAPFPWRPVGVLLLVRLGDGIISVMLYPMLPFMVRDFGVQPEHVGLYVGVLGTAYNLLQIPAGLIWGRASDRFGRKPIILIGQLTLAATTIALGFARSLPAALAARCLSGLLNGNLGVAAAAVNDVTEPQHRARAFSLLGFVFSLAFGLGPLIGSFLSRPATWEPPLRGTFLDEFPYLLPCIVAALICLLGAAALACLEFPKRKLMLPVAAAADDAASSGVQPLSAAQQRLLPSDERWAPALGSSLPEEEEAPVRQASDRSAVPLQAPLLEEEQPAAPADVPPRLSATRSTAAASASASLPAAAASGGFAALCVAHFGFGFVVAGGAELFPLFASAPPPDGLGFSTGQVGTALTPLAIGLFLGACSFPLVARRFGAVAAFRAAAALYFLSNLLIPTLRAVQAAGPTALWTAVVAVSFVRSLGGPLGFPALAVLLNSSLTRDAGLWNGVASSFLAAGRAAAPIAVGSVWSLTLLHEGGGGAPRPARWPLDFHLAFYCMCGVAALTWLLSLRFPRQPAGP